MTFHRRVLLAFSLAALTFSSALAQGNAQPRPNARADAGVLRLLPADQVSDHSISVANGKLDYAATVGTFPLFDGSGEHKASIVYTAYKKHDASSAARPVTK